MISHRFARLLGAVLLLAPSLAFGQSSLQQPVASGRQPDNAPVAIGKLYANDVFLQGLITSRFNTLGAAALLNVGTVTGTVADGGTLAAEVVRAQAAEQANATAISTETSRAQAAEALKAPLASPALTGLPTAPTAALGTSNTQIANMAAVAAAVAAGGSGSGGVPTSRQILTSGLAAGGGDLTADRTITVPAAAQSDVATGTDTTKALTSFSVAAALGAKAPLASPAFVGTPTAPTATAGTNTTQIANMAALSTALSSYAPLVSPALTGSPTVPTQAANDNSTKAASTAYADRAATNATSAIPAQPPVRQTVLSGPAASGAPSFLPGTTSATLTHTTTGISPTTPLVPTAAQGINTTTGTPLNYTAVIMANLSWTLTASATNFEFVNAQTGATYVSTLAPIYQNGGSISVTAGQFTFDYSPAGMVGYLGNGTTAVPTALVCIGEAVTSSTAVTSSAAYAYQGRFQSAPAAFTGGSTYVVPHNLGLAPENSDLTLLASTSSAGPWFPNAQAATGSYFVPAIQGNGNGRLGAYVSAGASGNGLSTGYNVNSTSGYFMVRARRAW